MFIYQNFSISTTAHLVPSEFPQLETSVQMVIKQLADEPDIKVEMLLSFLANHWINSAQVKDHPRLASLISTQSPPLQLMEALFEASRNNTVFKKELEDYIRNCFATATPNNGFYDSIALS